MQSPFHFLIHNRHLKKAARWSLVFLFALLAGRLVQITIVEVYRLGLPRDTVSLRKYVELFFRQGDNYNSIGLTPLAALYYDTGLQIQSDRLDYQFKLAKVHYHQKRYVAALERLEAVLEVCRDQKIIAKAQELIRKIKAKSSADFSSEFPSLIEENFQIALVPVGDPDKVLLQELIPKLEEAMKCKFFITDKTMPLGRPERDPSEAYIHQTFSWVVPWLSVEYAATLMRQLGAESADLKSKDDQERFLRSVMTQTNTFSAQEVAQFERVLGMMKALEQYDADRLISDLGAFPGLPIAPNIKAYLGVTEKDIFADNYAFLFASATAPVAVMSYARFKEGAGETDRTLLVERAYKQAVCSTFFSLGIPRCSAFYCVRAYPHSLAEFDRKRSTLCQECVRVMSRLLQIASPQRDSKNLS